jgi:hypothetical protein
MLCWLLLPVGRCCRRWLPEEQLTVLLLQLEWVT